MATEGAGMMGAIRTAGKILAFLVTSAVVGTGVGFWLGEMTARNWDRSASIYFAEGAADFGAVVALVVAPALYLLLRRRVSFGEFAVIATCTATTGALAALPGWEFFVPVAAVLGTAGAATAVWASRSDR